LSNQILKTAIANYGHTKRLKEKTISSDKFDMEHVEITPVPMIFRRMVRELEFDVAEMALSTYICAKHYEKPFTALPIFLTRSFYHSGIVCHSKSRIEAPDQLAGKKIGVRSYTLTPGVWTRGLLQTEYGLDLNSVTWVLSGDEHVLEYEAPRNVISSPNDDLAQMLLSREVDAVIGAGPISSTDVVHLFENASELDARWFKKTSIYPISHLLVVSDQKLEEDNELGADIYALYKKAKDGYLAELKSKQELNNEDVKVLEMQDLIGGDPLSYDLKEAMTGLKAFMKFNVEQQIVPSYCHPTELFAL